MSAAISTAMDAVGGRIEHLLGARTARGKFHEPDYWLITILLTLVMFGTVMVFSASFATSVQADGGTGYSYLMKQVLWVAIGLVGMVVAFSVDYRTWRRFSLPGIIAVVGLLAIVAVIPGSHGAAAFGAKRWIPLGPLTFQPSEVAKPLLILYLADWLGSKGAKIRHWSHGLLPFSIVLGTLIGLVMLQPDLGTSALLAAIGVGMFLVAGADLLQLGMLMSAGMMAFAVLALGASYRRARILIFLNPNTDLRNLGWQLAQARLALGSGGILGLGLGASRQKFSWLPAASTDAIFAVIGEELGLIGCALVLLLFLALAWRGYRIAKRAPDTFGALVAVGIVTWMIFQAAINIGGITTTIPFTGVPLPFISYGGTALAVSLTAMGILLNISRQTLDRVPVPAASPARPAGEARHPARPRRVPRPRPGREFTAPRLIRPTGHRSNATAQLDHDAWAGTSFGRARGRRPPGGRQHWE
ncbi:MAG TPA: putative lipid II flippase FtsW [Thermomicrobiaceae bacterium]|nr:putative lipid II flippase FtsW [Thermomicrobiaceae bacterium]